MRDKSDALDQGRSFARGVVLVILILSITASVWFGIVILFHIGIGEKEIGIDNSNRKLIRAMIPEEMAQKDDYKSLDHAVSIRRFYYIFKGKASLTIKYDDGSECFYMPPLVKDVPELSDYIEENGYYTYLRSSDFVSHILELCVPVIIGTACIIYRKKTRQTNNISEEIPLE